MKKLLLVPLVLLIGCYEHIPKGVIAQMTTERYLDSLYRPDTITGKIGVGYITIKQYFISSTQRRFQLDSQDYHLSKIDWVGFKKKIKDILSKGGGRDKGVITVENYRINGSEYTTAFLVDSNLRKVFATIPMN